MMRASPALLLALSACTAGWNSMVQYSSTPAPREENAELGLYRVVVSEYRRTDTNGLYLARPADTTEWPLAAATTGGPVDVPSHWADSLQRETQLALRDPARTREPMWDWLEQAAALEGVRLRSGADFSAALAAWEAASQRERDRVPLVRKLHLTRPGFNADSTLGVIDVDFWCGFVCGAGATLFLARRPGYRWRVWYSQVHWIS